MLNVTYTYIYTYTHAYISYFIIIELVAKWTVPLYTKRKGRVHGRQTQASRVSGISQMQDVTT